MDRFRKERTESSPGSVPTIPPCVSSCPLPVCPPGPLPVCHSDPLPFCHSDPLPFCHSDRREESALGPFPLLSFRPQGGICSRPLSLVVIPTAGKNLLSAPFPCCHSDRREESVSGPFPLLSFRPQGGICFRPLSLVVIPTAGRNLFPAPFPCCHSDRREESALVSTTRDAATTRLWMQPAVSVPRCGTLISPYSPKTWPEPHRTSRARPLRIPSRPSCKPLFIKALVHRRSRRGQSNLIIQQTQKDREKSA